MDAPTSLHVRPPEEIRAAGTSFPLYSSAGCMLPAFSVSRAESGSGAVVSELVQVIVGLLVASTLVRKLGARVADAGLVSAFAIFPNVPAPLTALVHKLVALNADLGLVSISVGLLLLESAMTPELVCGPDCGRVHIRPARGSDRSRLAGDAHRFAMVPSSWL